MPGLKRPSFFAGVALLLVAAIIGGLVWTHSVAERNSQIAAARASLARYKAAFEAVHALDRAVITDLATMNAADATIGSAYQGLQDDFTAPSSDLQADIGWTAQVQHAVATEQSAVDALRATISDQISGFATIYGWAALAPYRADLNAYYTDESESLYATASDAASLRVTIQEAISNGGYFSSIPHFTDSTNERGTQADAAFARITDDHQWWISRLSADYRRAQAVLTQTLGGAVSSSP